jgi:hypothetical protein
MMARLSDGVRAPDASRLGTTGRFRPKPSSISNSLPCPTGRPLSGRDSASFATPIAGRRVGGLYFDSASKLCSSRSTSAAWISPIVEIRNSSADSPPCPA